MAPLMDVDTTTHDATYSTKGGSRDFITQLGYTIPAADGGNISMDDLATENPTFREVRQVKIHDVRDSPEDFKLDVHGFQYHKLPSIPGEGEVDFFNHDDPKIPEVHYKGMADWYAKELGAREVLIYNHIVRNDKWAPHKYSNKYRGPAHRPHIDIARSFAPDLFRGIYSKMRPNDTSIETILATGKWKMINLWRPIKTIKRDPLAVLDTRSAAEEDIITTEQEYEPGYKVKNSWLKSGIEPDEPDEKIQHLWYYMSEQQPDEVVAFKMFDGAKDATSCGTAHTAVHVPGSEGEENRVSLEMRLFAIY